MPTRLLAALVAVAALVAACGGGDDAGSAAPAGDPGTSSGTGTEEPSVADPGAPDFLQFVADDVRGGPPIDASTYAGTDLVLWFWAPW